MKICVLAPARSAVTWLGNSHWRVTKCVQLPRCAIGGHGATGSS